MTSHSKGLTQTSKFLIFFIASFFSCISFAVQNLRGLQAHNIENGQLLPQESFQKVIIFVKDDCEPCLAMIERLRPCAAALSAKASIVASGQAKYFKKYYQPFTQNVYLLPPEQNLANYQIRRTPTVLVANNPLSHGLKCSDL